MTRLTYGYGLGFRHQRYGPTLVAAFGKYDMSQYKLVSFERNSLAWLNHQEYAVNKPRIDENGFLLVEDAATNYASDLFSYVYEADNTEFVMADNVIWIETKGLTTKWGVITPTRAVPEGRLFCRFDFLVDQNYPFPAKIIFSGSKGNKLHFGLNFDNDGNLISLSGANVVHTELVESGFRSDGQRYFIIASNDASNSYTSIRFGAYDTSSTEQIYKFGLRDIFIATALDQVKSSWVPARESQVTRAAERATLRRKL